jgi:hypothetical protein
MEFKFRKWIYKITFSWKWPFIKITRRKIWSCVKPQAAVSVCAGPSHGIEPVFNSHYERRKKLDVNVFDLSSVANKRRSNGSL